MSLNLSAIINTYDATRGGQPPLDPRLMTGLLLYGYCVGTTSSRKIERATYDSVPFRVMKIENRGQAQYCSALYLLQAPRRRRNLEMPNLGRQ